MAEFGSWAPDLPDFGHDGLVIARNTYAGSLGYEPFRSLAPVTADALSETWRGGGAFDASDGSRFLLAATDADLYSYSSATWTGKLPDTYSGQWFFAQFGDNVIGVNGGAPVKFNMATDTAGALGGSPPDASMVAIVRNFVFLAGDPAAQSTVTWSAVNNAEGWTIGTNQSDEQLIPDGGPITGLAGGEYGLVFQQSAISIFEYVGSPVIFQCRKISDALGSICPGGIAQAGKLVFFLSNRGFYIFNDGELTAIGKERVDRTFFATYSVLEIQLSLRCAIEPNLNLAIWSMPGRLWIYNWGTEKWSEVTDSSIIGITTGRTSYTTLDELEATFTGVDDVPTGTDDPLFMGGNPMLMIASSDGYHYTFGGSEKLIATFRQAHQEPYPGNEAYIRNVRPISDGTTGMTANLDCARRLGDAQTTYTATDVRGNGDMPLFATGRFIQPEVVFAADSDWTFCQGLELEGTAGARL
jgi:hypothetical protein